MCCVISYNTTDKIASVDSFLLHPLMAHLHCRKRTLVQTQDSDLKPDGYYAEHVRIVQTRTLIPTPHFYLGQESEYESVPESVSGNANGTLY